MSAIRFESVTYSVGDIILVRDLTFQVEPGETLVLLGKSGSGKTTILKLINHLLTPTCGSIFVEGRSTNEWDPIRLRRKIGYVIQEIGLFPHFTVFENVALVPRLENWDADRTRTRVAEVLQLVDLDPQLFGHRYPRELSGGQRQRVGVARALCADPPILLMDEPFGALDPISRSEIQREFQTLQKQLQKTIVFVTHDVAEAMLFADRVALLQAGRFIALEKKNEFYDSSNTEVQAFLAPWKKFQVFVE